MKVEENNDGINIFLNNIYFKDVIWDSKSTIEESIRDIILKVKKYYKVQLKGFYKIKIYPHEVGVFIEVIKLDDDNYDGSDIEFRVMVIFNKEMYLKTSDISYISDVSNIIFYNDNYYVDLDSIDNILSVIDMGQIVFEDEIDFDKCIYIKKDYC